MSVAEREAIPEVQPVEHETRDRIITGFVTVLPAVALGVACWQAWSNLLHWSDLVVFAVMYAFTGLGVTVGFHRHFTHRSFATSSGLRAVLAVLGSAAIEGPVISWVADHRKHHAFSDEEGDPHSPHVGHGKGWRGALAGLMHAHVGWLFIHTHRGAKARYARDLLGDPAVRFVDRTFVLWALAGLAVAFGLGVAIGGSVIAGLTGLLWGGGVRMLVVHHVTYSINSLCHFFGRRPFATGDESRNLLARAADLRRGVAQQPPRLPHLGDPRSSPLGDRRLRARDQRPREGRTRLGRRACGARAHEAEGSRRDRLDGPAVLARTAPLRDELERTLPERPFSVELWDGTSVPATNGGGPTFSVRSRAAVAHALRAPGQLGLGRAYVSGEIDVDDLDAVLELLGSWKPPPIDRSGRTRLLLAAARACGLQPPPRVPASELKPRGRRHSSERDARAVRHHYDLRVTSSRSSSTSR